MRNIEKKKMERFSRITKIILDKLRLYKIEPITRYDSTIPNRDYGNSMSISYKFNEKNLKHWYLGIWGCGKWSDTYDTESEDYISIFLIHKWHLDKFRPSSADLEFRLNIYRKPIKLIELKIENYIIPEIIKLQDNPILEYYNIFGKRYHNHPEEDSHDLPYLEYFRDWISNEVTTPLIENLSKNWSVKFLYGILKILSLVDPRVSRGKLFYDKDCFSPWYISGFLAKEWVSDRDWAFNSFAWLYYKLPTRLCKLSRHRLFNAYWNVADIPSEITNNLEKRMKRGVII